jgi:phosphoglycolate phosphatase/putative hydrolase of the HAD superfamily
MGDTLTGPIRAVLFDVDGTLYAQPPLRAAMALEMAVTCVLPTRRHRVAIPRVLAFRRCREELRGDHDRAEPLARRQYTVAAERLGCTDHEVECAVEEWIYRRPNKWLRFCRRSGLVQLLDGLQEKGMLCGVFSDYPAEHKLAALGLEGRFGLILSALDPEIDVFKPDPRGFLAAATRWDVPASQVLYVGDRYDVDAEGALAAGMRCAVVTSEEPRNFAKDVIAVRNFKELHRVLSHL